MSGAVTPEELLVEHYRGHTWKDWAAEAVAAGAVRWTRDEHWGRAMLSTAKKLGALQRKEAFFAFKDLPFSEEYQNQLHFELKEQAIKQLAAVSKSGIPQLEVLITGGTGFIGMDLLGALAPDPAIKKLYCIVWHKELGASSPAEFKTKLLNILSITDPGQAAKIEVLPGDVTQPNMGLAEDVLKPLEAKVTHLVHLAASVSFEDPYDKMFKANVTATQVVLEFARRLQNAPKSPFVNFVATETCYVHGRDVELCREDRLHFPRDYYNNYYELTKALGDLYSRHFSLEHKLRVISLCPAITVGQYRTGNNRGDTKVINAAVNAFGRIGQELQQQRPVVRWLVSRCLSFPGMYEAKLNLVCVDRITAGLHSALTRPLATGERVHLGMDGIRIRDLDEVFRAEMGLHIRFVNPSFHRVIHRPLMGFVGRAAGLGKTFEKLELLFNIFSSYAEWGQPVHELGNDVRYLGLSVPRPDVKLLAHMMARHNKTVQEFGKVRDKTVLTDRERRWASFIAALEQKHGKHAGALTAAEFNEELKKGY